MHPVSPGSPSDDADPLATAAGPTRYRDAFAVADELAVHGSDCVCPTCAGPSHRPAERARAGHPARLDRLNAFPGIPPRNAGKGRPTHGRMR